MGEWKTCTLAELGTIVGGATPSTKKAENYDDGNIPWVTPKDLSGYNYRYISRGERNITEAGLKSCSTQMMPKNSVLFTSRAPIGYIAIAKNDICTNQGFKSIVPNEFTDYMFLYYLLKYNKNNIENMGSGTTFKEVSGTTMRGITVSVPVNIEEQKKIASMLALLDDKIEENIKINDNLFELVSTIYEQQFENLSSMPNGWRQGKLLDIAFISSGKRPPVKETIKTETAFIPIVGAASIMGYTTDANHTDKILVTGRVGTHGVIQRFNSPCWTSDNTLVITSPYYEYTCQLLKRIDYASLNRGSTQPLITQGDMNKIDILIPDKAILDEFEALTGTLMAQYEANLIENKELAELRDSLLPQLMSGELDVSTLDL